jgi:hypothetical protein
LSLSFGLPTKILEVGYFSPLAWLAHDTPISSSLKLFVIIVIGLWAVKFARK